MNQMNINGEMNNRNKSFINLPENQRTKMSNEDFVRIERINERLQQLHVFGEIFAENGFLVRSDARSKTNIEEIHSALSGVLNLCGVTYSYNNNDNDKRYGFIAQEVEKQFPNLVKEDDDGKLSVDYLGVIPILVEALKEIHSNTQGFHGVEELTAISTRVDDAIDRLEHLLFELTSVNPQQQSMSQFEDWKWKMLHLFGPTPFLLFFCLFISIICIIIPIVLPSMYFLVLYITVYTLVLWIFVVINRKEILHFLNSRNNSTFTIRDSFKQFQWNSTQYVSHYLSFCILMEAIILSIIIGANVSIVAITYIVFSCLALGFSYFVFKISFKYGFPKQLAYVLIAFLQLIAIIVISLFAHFQPFYEGKAIVKEHNSYTILLSEKVEVTHIEMPGVSWNCFSPEIKTEPDLPLGLSFVASQALFSKSTPVLTGIPQGEIGDAKVKVSLQCNGAIKLDYPELIFKTCAQNTDPGLCSVNGCGYCRSSVRPFCGICGDYFSQQCATVSGVEYC